MGEGRELGLGEGKEEERKGPDGPLYVKWFAPVCVARLLHESRQGMWAIHPPPQHRRPAPADVAPESRQSM
jgi:hypothetical protein